MAKKKFDFAAYQKAAPIYKDVKDNTEFLVIVGTKRQNLNDVMDKAGQHLLKSAKFHLVNKVDDKGKKVQTCEIVSYKKKANYYLTDEQYMLLDILLDKKQVEKFFKNYEFSPQGFAEFARSVLRPISMMAA